MAVSRGALAVVGMAMTCWSASAAELTATLSKENRTIIAVNGAFANGDASRFKDLVKTSAAAGQPVFALRLNSPGGSLKEGERFAAAMRGMKIATVVAAGATCAGACFIPFIAGNQKFASATATVAAPGAKQRSEHQPAGNTPVVVRAETPEIIKIVKGLGLLDAIVTKMRETPEDDVSTLTRDDLRAMGATVTGRPTRLIPSVQCREGGQRGQSTGLSPCTN